MSRLLIVDDEEKIRAAARHATNAATRSMTQ